MSMMETAPPAIVVWKGAPQWLAPLCGVTKPEAKMGQVVFNLTLGEYLFEWTTTPRSPKEKDDDY